MDWDDLRYFLAIARHHTLSAAARELRVTQSTMGRRLDGLESHLGVRLLKRTPNGYVLTSAGKRVLVNTERMEIEALSLERKVGGCDVQLNGNVRVTTVETLGATILTRLLAEFQRRLPGISLELVMDNRTLSLSKRDADIAVRLARPQQLDLIVKKVGNVAFALYASKAYLRQHGAPDFVAGCEGHSVIALHDEIPSFLDAQWLAKLASKAKVVLSSNSRYSHLEAAVEGVGMACLPRYLADRHKTLVRLKTPGGAPLREIWLAVHKDTRQTARVRAVFDAIAAGLRLRSSMLNPN